MAQLWIGGMTASGSGGAGRTAQLWVGGVTASDSGDARRTTQLRGRRREEDGATASGVMGSTAQLRRRGEIAGFIEILKRRLRQVRRILKCYSMKTTA
ncbi:hypothetical protein BDA96_10G059200 [Sorghum bicolor]|nr:hypothetical protein BDA96_10G059200 [Sorghum bicolor]